MGDCGGPCEFGTQSCQRCAGYWTRMVREGLWEPGRGWTAAGMKAIISGQNERFVLVPVFPKGD